MSHGSWQMEQMLRQSGQTGWKFGRGSWQIDQMDFQTGHGCWQLGWTRRHRLTRGAQFFQARGICFSSNVQGALDCKGCDRALRFFPK